MCRVTKGDRILSLCKENTGVVDDYGMSFSLNIAFLSHISGLLCFSGLTMTKPATENVVGIADQTGRRNNMYMYRSYYKEEAVSTYAAVCTVPLLADLKAGRIVEPTNTVFSLTMMLAGCEHSLFMVTVDCYT